MVRRATAAVTTALIVTALAIQPAFALGWNAGAFTGQIGQFQGPPNAEVVCRYNSAGLLRSVTVKPLRMWGSHTQPTVVGWRYQLREAVEFRRGRLIYGSPTWKEVASVTQATTTFNSRRFYLNRDVSRTSAYYVRPVMFWYAPGSSTDVEGRGVVLYDRYVKKMGTQSTPANACTYEFSDTWGD